MTFWTVWTLDRINETSANQLSETKIYAHPYVNKSITAQFKNVGNYANASKLSCVSSRAFSIQSSKMHKPSLLVVSTNTKSSTSTMVYAAGIFHLASVEQTPNPIQFTNTIIHENPRV